LENLIPKLEDIENIEILQNEPMNTYTSFKIGGCADIYIKVKSIKGLKETLKIIKENNVPMFIIGNGTNLLIKDGGIRGVVVKLDFKDVLIEENNDNVIIEVGSGVLLMVLAQKLYKEGIQGFEFASRNTRYNWWSYKNECRCTWRRNERYSYIKHIYGYGRKNIYSM